MAEIWSNTIGDLIRRSSERFAEKTALHFAERSWSYRELELASNRLANHLIDQGLNQGDRVAAYGRNSDSYLLLWLACAKAGLVHVPVNYGLIGEELAYILNQSGSRALFYDKELEENIEVVNTLISVAHFGELEGPGSSAIRVLASQGSASAPGVSVKETDLAQLLYTSGTTSRPKGAMMTHRALIQEYMSCIVDLDFSGADRPLHALPLYHSAQMHVFLMPYLILGANNYLLQVPEAGQVLKVVEDQGLTSIFAPPTVWINLMHHPDFDTRDLGCLKRAYYGASIMPAPVLSQLLKKLPNLAFYNCFGQSEIAPLATVLRPEDHKERPDSAGKPVLFVELRVVNDEMQDVATGEIGEIVYRSPQLCQGYWDNPEETKEAFTGGWFHSGDLARLDEAHYLYIVDRKKDVVNTGGVLVTSREVEDQLYTHPAVKEAAVISTPDKKWIEAVTAIVVLKEGMDISEEELKTYAEGRLSHFKIPKHIYFTPDLPRNASGKILKRELRERYNNPA